MNSSEPECRKTGIVFNIQKFTVHDGPGIRTEVFLKGCYLRCLWCSNPESLEAEIQLGLYPGRCIGIEACGKCLAACSRDALIVRDGKIAVVDRSLCTGCMDCQKVCPTPALKCWGQEMSLEEVMKVIRDDKPFYENSGGGVTISGGEALYQWEFTKAILEQCRAEGINTCVESALQVRPEVLDEILPFTDLLITDIKCMDSVQHRKCTGSGNERILENIRRAAASGVPMVIRLPIIPGINDREELINKAADFIESLGSSIKQVQFLRFRRLGEEKYASLGKRYNMIGINPPREEFEEKIKHLVAIMTERGIPAYAGTTHKIII